MPIIVHTTRELIEELKRRMAGEIIQRFQELLNDPDWQKRLDETPDRGLVLQMAEKMRNDVIDNLPADEEEKWMTCGYWLNALMCVARIVALAGIDVSQNEVVGCMANLVKRQK